jgi:hypothetical protein
MKFPLEVWQLIFNHFDSVSLKRCLLWSKTFRELVITTPTLMRKLPVIFSGKSNKSQIAFIKQHGKHVKAMNFDGCEFRDVDVIKQILMLTPNLESFVCKNLKRDESEAIENDRNIEDEDISIENACYQGKALELTKLSKLEIGKSENFSLELLKLFRGCHSLESFEFSIGSDIENIENHLREFIMKQCKLERLKLVEDSSFYRMMDVVSSEDFEENFEINLKSFAFVSNLPYNETFSRFLMKQSMNIEELTLHNYQIDFHYIRLILNNFHNLRKLSISICSLLTDSRAKEIKNIRLPTVKELEFVDYCDDLDVVSTLIDIFPNVEALTMELNNFHLRGLLEKLPKLKKLSSSLVPFDTLAFAKSKSLTELRLSNVKSIADPFFMELLAQNLPNLETFVVHNIDVGKLHRTVDKDVEILLTSLKLFTKLKSFELVNDVREVIVFNQDADANEPEAVEQNPLFKLTITTEKDQKRMKCSEYFVEKHSDVIDKLKLDLRIDYVEIENE